MYDSGKKGGRTKKLGRGKRLTASEGENVFDLHLNIR